MADDPKYRYRGYESGKRDLKIVNTLLFVDGIIVILTYLFDSWSWFINSQVSILSSSLVISATIYSYRKSIKMMIEVGYRGYMHDRDAIDKIEDPHSLYGDRSDEVESSDGKPKRADRLSTRDAIKHSKASLSLYRLGAYAILIIGFLLLNGSGELDILPYMLGLAIPPYIVARILSLHIRY